MTHAFQIDLRGIIDLLSNHLYSEPRVFLRELMQNAVDAITARGQLEQAFDAQITLSVSEQEGQVFLTVTDNGVGLTESEVHEFLATIGRSSKRSDLPTSSFIGQFGIGLLSCFVVSDEITLVTTSAKESRTLQWNAVPSGAYTLTELPEQKEVGTTVVLRAKPEHLELFGFEFVRDTCMAIGGMLPYPIVVQDGKHQIQVNHQKVPWRTAYPSEQHRRDAILLYGEALLGVAPFDFIELKSQTGGVQGLAFILPWSSQVGARGRHLAYLKNMLLSDHLENLLPEWAFFVRAVVNIDDLRPTASRESLYEDSKLAKVREVLGNQVKNHLHHLSTENPKKLQELLQLHYLPMKALALEDDDFYRVLIHHFPFETTLGRMTLSEYLRHTGYIRFVPHLDQFRQISQIAAAYGHFIINAAYTYDAALLSKYSHVYPDASVEALDASSYAYHLTEVEHPSLQNILQVARKALQGFDVEVNIRAIEPPELPALLVASEAYKQYQQYQRTRKVASELWASVIEDLIEQDHTPQAQLFLNFNNATVHQVLSIQDELVLTRVVRMLYVQAMLMGHHPLGQHELKLLSDGLMDMIAWGIRASVYQNLN